MDPRVKALIVVLPLLIAAYVGFSLLMPALDESGAKDKAIEEKRVERDGYDTKIKAGSQVSAKQNQLNKEIAALRDSVPKAPDIDLLTIDLEKMCKDAGMNMVAIQGPKSDGNTPAPKAVESTTTKKQDKLKNLLKGNATDSSASTAAANTGGKGELEQSTKQLIVTGDFNGLEKLVHELETYQRVVKIDNINFHLSKKPTGKDKVKIDDQTPSEGDEVGNPDLMFITLDITTYYLP